ncbi:MAG: hypothetical protein KUG63_11520 [Cycloclasticus sp.]|nr:hypothetical protein [Cycloclasticus sp.]
MQPSNRIRWFAYSVFIFALMACWLNALAFPAQVMLSVFVILMIAHTVHIGALNVAQVKKIRCKENADWLIQRNHDKPHVYRLKETTRLLGPLIFLHFQSDTKTLYLALSSDSMTNEENRKLRVALRVYKNQLLNPKV